MMYFQLTFALFIAASFAYGDTFRLEHQMEGENLKNNHIWMRVHLANGKDYCKPWSAADCSSPNACQSCMVWYMTGAERDARKLSFDNKNQLWLGADGKPYDTKTENEKYHVRVMTVTDKRRLADWGIIPGIWVVSPSGELYTSVEHATGRFHHSSFLAGGLVEGAGLIVFDHGKITHIDNESGHYRPDRASFKKMLSVLHVSDLSVAEYTATSPEVGSATRIRTTKPGSAESTENLPAHDMGYTGYDPAQP